MDTMTYIRTYVAKWWIDSVEASRPGKVAVPAITDLARQLRQTWDTNVPKKSNNRKRRK
jgi:hypothetical protein